MNTPKQKDSRLAEPKAHSPNELSSKNLTQSYTYPYLLTMSDKDRQMVASNWLLNKELRKKLEIKTLELSISEFRSLINKETGLIYFGTSAYFITWLDDLTKSDYVRVSFRRSLVKGECLNYCVVKS